MTKHASLIFILLQAAVLQATVIHVPADQPTIQAGITASTNGDTVLVARGRYYENIIFRGKNITVASQYLLSGDLADIDSTVIDGSTPVKPDTASCVLFINGEDSTAVLCGLTLTGGKGTRWQDEHYGSYWREAGAVLIALSSPTIRNNLMIDNHVTNINNVNGAGGGAIRAGDGNPRILNNVIMRNTGISYGGGIVLNFCGGIIKNNVIHRNYGGSSYGGGGIWIYNAGPYPKIIENNTIVNNRSDAWGGGIECGNASAIGNNIIWGNIAPTGSQIHDGSTSAISFNDIQGGWAGTGNIDLDPQFYGRNFYLAAGSPGIDAGDPASVYNDPEDPGNPDYALWPAQGSLRNDLGAYGGPGSATLPRLPTEIIPVYPLPGSSKVGLTAPLTIAFSGPADTSSLSYTFSDPGIALIRQWNGRSDTLTLAHSQPFANLSWYSLVITAGLDSSGAVLIPLPDTIGFRATDTVRPRLGSTVPEDGAAGVSATLRPRFIFTKPANRSSLHYVFSDTNYHFTNSWLGGDTIVQLLHNSRPFAPGTTYTLTLTAISDTFGNALGGCDVPNPFSFTTLPAGVESGPAPACRPGRIGPVRPNPARAGQPASVELDLGRSGPVTVTVYNALGQMATVCSDMIPASGRHAVRIGGSRLAPGVYFVLVRAGTASALLKHTIIR